MCLPGAVCSSIQIIEIFVLVSRESQACVSQSLKHWSPGSTTSCVPKRCSIHGSLPLRPSHLGSSCFSFLPLEIFEEALGSLSSCFCTLFRCSSNDIL